MATIEKFKHWVEKDLGNAIHDRVECVSMPHGVFDDEPHEDSEATVSERRLVIRLHTSCNSYQISAVEMVDGASYLGCIAKSRRPRAGEDWHRGNDLPDGRLERETWARILARIVSYEMVKVHRQAFNSDWEVPPEDDAYNSGLPKARRK